MNTVQQGILQNIPSQARYLSFSLKPKVDPRSVLQQLNPQLEGDRIVAGLGLSLIQRLNGKIQGLDVFPAQVNAGIEIPSTPVALCLWLRGDDRGELLHKTRELQQLLSAAFRLDRVVDAFQYGASLDLTGYEDGTENPEEEDAVEVAIVTGLGEGMDGSTFMAMQQWEHDLDTFQSFSSEAQDHTIGRRISDNEEIEDAPESAHVKRTAQEDFDPEAFVLRRSMPWADESNNGLVFVAFGHSFSAFEALLNRMIAKDDGIPDALFNFTRPITGCYLWCPPMKNGRLDLSFLKI